MITVPIRFINPQQLLAFNDQKRNLLASGGFGSGKTYAVCQKAIILLTAFNNYRVAICRQEFKSLKKTTMSTFFKLCPPELYAPPLGRFNEQEGLLRFINGSEVFFMHLDIIDEQTLRGLEINTVLIDQAEEVSEQIWDILDGRIGRWDKSNPGEALLEAAGGIWERNEFGAYKIPAYFLNTCNPEHETHFLYRRFHPESPEFAKWSKRNTYIEFPSTENPALDKENLEVMLSKDPAWVQRYVYGKWGISEASIHRLLPLSIIDPDPEWLRNLLKKALLYRILDHGDASPTCCLWCAFWKGQYFFYREYYMPGKLISDHRRNIADLSGDELYVANYADPSIFNKTSQKKGGFWSVADEYLDVDIDAKPIPFLPADNNEMMTRNRLNEFLSLSKNSKHPLTGEYPAPHIYFIKGACPNAEIQIKAARRVKLSEINGKPIYSDERAKGEDHAYDPVRYMIAVHNKVQEEPQRPVPENSFLAIRNRMKALKMEKYYDKTGWDKPAA